MMYKFAFLLFSAFAFLTAEATNSTISTRACAQQTTGYAFPVFDTLPTITYGIHVDFTVRTASDALLLLTVDGDTSLPLYEIHIGSASDTISSIRDNQAGVDVVRVSTPDYLDANAFRSFWLRYMGGVIEVGQNGQTIPFLHYTTPTAYDFNRVGFSSWVGTSADWIIYANGVSDSFQTANYAYTHYEVLQPESGNVQLQFGLRASSDAVVLLSRTAFPSVGTPVYEILISSTSRGLAAKHTAVRRLAQAGPELGAVLTPDLLHPTTFVCFWLDVSTTGLIQLGVVGETVPAFQYQDTEPPIHPAYYSFSSDYTLTADWRAPCGCVP